MRLRLASLFLILAFFSIVFAWYFRSPDPPLYFHLFQSSGFLEDSETTSNIGPRNPKLAISFIIPPDGKINTGFSQHDMAVRGVVQRQSGCKYTIDLKGSFAVCSWAHSGGCVLDEIEKLGIGNPDFWFVLSNSPSYQRFIPPIQAEIDAISRASRKWQEQEPAPGQ